MKRSAGILPYRLKDGIIEVYLEHPGGPYWEGKDLWSICKGEYKEEKAIDAAIREFNEETSFTIDKDELFFIGSIKLDSTNKLVTVFGTNKNFDASKMKSNTFMLEWPKGSGTFHEFPEMDEGKWFKVDDAYKVIFKGQEKILDKLIDIISDTLK